MSDVGMQPTVAERRDRDRRRWPDERPGPTIERMGRPFTRSGGQRLEAAEPVEGHLRGRSLGQWPGEVSGVMPVRASTGTRAHVPAEGERALALYSLGAAAAVPRAEIARLALPARARAPWTC